MGMSCSAKITKRNRLGIRLTSWPQGLERSGGLGTAFFQVLEISEYMSHDSLESKSKVRNEHKNNELVNSNPPKIVEHKNSA